MLYREKHLVAFTNKVIKEHTNSHYEVNDADIANFNTELGFTERDRNFNGLLEHELAETGHAEIMTKQSAGPKFLNREVVRFQLFPGMPSVLASIIKTHVGITNSDDRASRVTYDIQVELPEGLGKTRLYNVESGFISPLS